VTVSGEQYDTRARTEAAKRAPGRAPFDVAPRNLEKEDDEHDVSLKLFAGTLRVVAVTVTG
jgi:hypothetical protein